MRIDNVLFWSATFMPAIATMTMIFNLRFGREPTSFIIGFFVNLFYFGLMMLFYGLAPSPRMFDDSYGPVLMPGSAVVTASAFVGVLLAGMVVIYEDLRALWDPDNPPKDKEDIPEGTEERKDVKGDVVVPIRRHSA